MRTLITLSTLLLVVSPALAKEGDGGVPLEIQVVDLADGSPIGIARVRNVKEKELQSVNTETGAWKGDVLYLPDGTEVVFEKGLVLQFEVSAAGYSSYKFDYEMKKRKNRVVVQLEKVVYELPKDDSVIQFDRDELIGGRPIE